MNWRWLDTLPTTQVRLAVSLLMSVATCVRYLASSDWKPDVQWLVFLATALGLDAAHFYAKRATDTEYTAAKQTPSVPPAGG